MEGEEIEEEKDEGGNSSNIEPNEESTLKRPEKKLKNGAVGNTVIARSKYLIMVPNPITQNHDCESDESQINQSSPVEDKSVTHLSPNKEVILYFHFSFLFLY